MSGDWNPIHVSIEGVRRSFLGHPIVYGVQQVLWALETWSTINQTSFILKGLKAKFVTPLHCDEAVCLKMTAKDDMVTFLATVCGETTTEFVMHWEHATVSHRLYSTPTRRDIDSPDADTVLGQCGTIDVEGDHSIFSKMFPHLCANANFGQVVLLLTISRVVGMHIPGEYSLLSSLDLSFTGGDLDGLMQYRVTSYDGRFSRASLHCNCVGFIGDVVAFFRPNPVVQASSDELREIVRPDEFRGYSALVLGGSRGLGEVAAKLLAVGGASVSFSYYAGLEQAKSIASELEAIDCTAKTFYFDAFAPEKCLEEYAKTLPSSLLVLYFCSPPWTLGRRGGFDPEYARRCEQVYCQGLERTLNFLAKYPKMRLRVLNPSSALLDTAPAGMEEYVEAKRLAETICCEIGQRLPLVRCLNKRFPRLLTDQTASVLARRPPNPAPVILDALRELVSH